MAAGWDGASSMYLHPDSIYEVINYLLFMLSATCYYIGAKSATVTVIPSLNQAVLQNADIGLAQRLIYRTSVADASDYRGTMASIVLDSVGG